MPNSTRAIHPSGKLGITFTEENHLYVDDFQNEYTSVTTLIHEAFAPFNASKAAAEKSKKTGVPAEQYLREWQDNAIAAATAGTRTHENCERQILGRYAEMHSPVDEAERARFRTAWFEVERLRARFARLDPEKLVFSPRFRVAGSIDLLAHENNDDVAIFDWKFIKELRREAFAGRVGTHFATLQLQDCNFSHYSLQLNIYEQILKIEGYIAAESVVRKYLLVYDFEQCCFRPTPVPDLPREALLLMSWNITNDGLENIPF